MPEVIPNDKLRWKLRRACNRIRDYGLWVRQGRPDFMPIVVKRGTITKCQHGYALVDSWHWSFTFQTNGPVDGAHMVDILGAQYGVTRVKELDCCSACQSYVTA